MLRSALTFAGVLAILVLPAFTAGCKATGPAPAPAPGTAAAVVLPTGNPHPGFCPVLGEPVDMVKAEATPALQSDHEGKKYLFCCEGCKTMFDKDPAKYIANPAQPKK
jgi:YHS domain-containing protein